jgi:hypothetical protein
MIRISVLTAVLALPAAGAAATFYCPDHRNLVANCGFEVDTAGWAVSAESFTRTEASAHGGVASAEGLALFNPVNDTYRLQISTCSPVHSGGLYRVGAWFESVASGPVANCRAWLQAHGSTNCIGPVLDFFNGSWVTAQDGVWTASVSSTTLPVGTRGVATFAACTHSPVSFVVRVDDIFLLGPLFADGFETGDAGEWSAVEP